MIYIIMHGRLGNQMFQYAFAKKIQESRNDKISIYFGRVNRIGGSDWKDDLQNFNVDEYKIETNIKFLITKMSVRQKFFLFSYLLKCRTFKDADDLRNYQCTMQNKLNENGLYWLRNGEFVPKISKAKNIFICGHFEHYTFYVGMERKLRQIFIPKYPQLKINTNLYEIIDNTESICISIRRGDYLKLENRQKYFLCDKNYFDKAIETIRKRVPNATLIFFSDDIDWVKENYKYDGEVYYEMAENPVWEKVRLMSRCKHFVISNSTFSWWVQYLSNNPEKIVVSPDKWKNNSNYKGLIDPKFITIHV